MINVRKQNKPSYECMMNAETALALCKRASENEFKEYHCSTGLVFLAFAVEAMFIFIGGRLIQLMIRRKTKLVVRIFIKDSKDVWN
ncbi:hypothetical protein LPA81_23710 (plasmid) [Salmonella enterica subsp. enterica]|uniref:hypothetical protein n=1 Tax=Salmonella enterica TaxID=28901 RepID=UPI00352B9397